MDAVVQALSDENRRSILETLRQGPATVNEIAGSLAIARPGVSRHLRILREAGLVQVRKDEHHILFAFRDASNFPEWDLVSTRAQAQRRSRFHVRRSRGSRGR